jgi:uncharacterized protein
MLRDRCTALALACALVGVGAVVSAVGVASADEPYHEQIRKWRADREARLRADGGWLTVVGLIWLREGRNSFGSDAACDIVLPPGSAPAVAGAFSLAEGRVSVALEPGVAGSIGQRAVTGSVELRPDTAGAPDVLELGRLSLHVIERSGRLGIRLKDRESPLRKAFTGLSWFPIAERYRIEARFVRYDPPKALKVQNVLGNVSPMPSPGRAEFTIDGRTVQLDGVLEEPDATELFFIFRDQTSGQETYGAGRFLYAEMPKDGKLVLDFNKAYSPPCAFTPYATCPLPPLQNRLPVRIEAGEKTYGHGH